MNRLDVTYMTASRRREDVTSIIGCLSLSVSFTTSGHYLLTCLLTSTDTAAGADTQVLPVINHHTAGRACDFHFKVLRVTQQETGHFRDVLTSQSLVAVLKKLNLAQLKQTFIRNTKMLQAKTINSLHKKTKAVQVCFPRTTRGLESDQALFPGARVCVNQLSTSHCCAKSVPP